MSWDQTTTNTISAASYPFHSLDLSRTYHQGLYCGWLSCGVFMVPSCLWGHRDNGGLTHRTSYYFYWPPLPLWSTLFWQHEPAVSSTSGMDTVILSVSLRVDCLLSAALILTSNLFLDGRWCSAVFATHHVAEHFLSRCCHVVHQLIYPANRGKNIYPIGICCSCIILFFLFLKKKFCLVHPRFSSNG